eukprot:scaffold101_cov63-Phaeocystis_antarctica.AAC.4
MAPAQIAVTPMRTRVRKLREDSFACWSRDVGLRVGAEGERCTERVRGAQRGRRDRVRQNI